MSAEEALQRLLEGNQRYAADVRSLEALASHTRRRAMADAQRPFAIILGCSDSRVPAEIVFDQGLGTLFVIRVAGHVVSRSQVASVEFAAEAFGARLVVVLGHSRCGAVTATLQALTEPAGAPRSMAFIVDLMRPAITPLLDGPLARAPDALLAASVRANVRAATDQLRHGSSILEQLRSEAGLRVVGAEYDLETGLVVFFDPDPAAPTPPGFTLEGAEG